MIRTLVCGCCTNGCTCPEHAVSPRTCHVHQELAAHGDWYEAEARRSVATLVRHHGEDGHDLVEIVRGRGMDRRRSLAWVLQFLPRDRRALWQPIRTNMGVFVPVPADLVSLAARFGDDLVITKEEEV